MSPLVLLGSLGTLLSALTMIPHLTHALRTRQPSGSTLAWTLGTVCSAVWFVYGVAGRDLLVAAPGLVTIPIGAVLAAWARRGEASAQRGPAMVPAVVPTMLVVPDWEPPEGYRAGDTLELPRVVA